MLLQILNRAKDIRISPPNKAEKLQYRAIKKAIETGRCQIVINTNSFNKKNSPVYNVMENFIPLLVMIVLSLTILLATNVIFGLTAILLSVFTYLFVFRAWAEKMVLQRVYTLMMRNYYNFHYLWHFGEVTLLLVKKQNIGCKSPKGDWKSFASLHFADLMTISSLPPAPELPQIPQPPIPEIDPELLEEGEMEGEFDENDPFNLDDLDLK